MKLILITARPDFMPDSEDFGTWQPMPDEDGFFMQTLGDYHLFVHECLPNLSSETYNVKLLVEKKHALVASWLNTIISFAKKQGFKFSKEEIYAILHDRDLISHDDHNEEGIYHEERIISVGGGLEGMTEDGHVYIFMHSVGQDMCVALINDLIEPSKENVEQALRLINKCADET